MCKFLCGGSGDNKDIMSSKILAWICYVKAHVKALEGLCSQGRLMRWVPTFITNMSVV